MTRGVEVTVWPDTVRSLERAALLADHVCGLEYQEFRRFRVQAGGFLGDQEDWALIRDDLLQWARDAHAEMAAPAAFRAGRLDQFGDYTMGDAA
jgi:hypothetical protein